MSKTTLFLGNIVTSLSVGATLSESTGSIKAGIAGAAATVFGLTHLYDLAREIAIDSTKQSSRPALEKVETPIVYPPLG